MSIVPLSMKIEELQTKDTVRLVRDKAMKAFKEYGRKLFVEHTGLYLEYINDLPGGLTQIIWDSLEADLFAELFGATSNTRARAKTTIGYIDGKQFHEFIGEIEGSIVNPPRGNPDFQWDCVFLPDGKNETFAEMGDKKNEISMRRKALDKFAFFLKQETST